MRFSRRNKSLRKYITSSDINNHKIKCSECNAIEDFDDRSILEANKNSKEHTWREGLDENNNRRVFCPECVELLKPKTDGE